MKYTPLTCQAEGTNFMIDRKRSGLIVRMGVGKTASCLTAIEELTYNRAEVRRVLVAAPKRVALMTWPDEIEKWDHTRRLTYTVLHGKDKLHRLKREARDADVTIINYEGLQWLYNNKEYMPRYDLMVFDESTYAKNGTSGRSKIAHAMSRLIPRVVIMTGTFKPNGLENIWSQMFLVDRGQRLGLTLTSFRERYMLQKDKRLWVPKHGALDEVLDLIKDLVLVVEDTSGVGLPPVVDNIINVELPPKARQMYTELETKWVTTMDDGEVLRVLNQQGMSQKLRQAANGFLYLDDKVPTDIHKEKLEALDELREGIKGNLLVAINFKYEIDLIRKYFGYEVPAIYSGTQEKRSDMWMREWMEGKLPMMLAHPASMSHGLNMQGGGCDVAWFSLTWDLEHWQQFIARLRRRGSQYTTIFNHIIRAKSTIDDVMLDIVTRKGADQEYAVNYIRQYIKSLKRKI